MSDRPPTSKHERPARGRLRVEALPAAAQAWLRAHAAASAETIVRDARLGPLLALLGALAAAALVLRLAFAARRVWQTPERLAMAALLIGAALLVAWAARRVVRVARSPYGRFVTIHPRQLVQVDVDRVTVWPLAAVQDVSLAHHTAGGGYTHTTCRINLAGGGSIRLTIHGQQVAVDWARRLLDARDAADGEALVPPSLFAGGAAAVPAPGARVAYGTAAAVGLVLFATALPLNLGAGERWAWRSAARGGSVRELRAYVAAFPHGKHVADARAALDAAYDRAIFAYARGSGGAAPAGRAVEAVLRAVAASGGRPVAVTYAARLDFAGLAAFGEAGVVAPEPAFTAARNRPREHALTSALRDALASAFGADVLDLDDAAPPGRAPATLALGYRVRPSGTVYEASGARHRRYYGIVLAWELRILDGGGATIYHAEFETQPARDLRYTTDGDGGDDVVPYAKMAESAFADAAQRLAAELGAPTSRATASAR